MLKSPFALLTGALALLFGLSAASPLQAAALRHFTYQERIGGQVTDLELYATDPEVAQQTATAIWQRLNQQLLFLQGARQLVSRAHLKTTPISPELEQLLSRLQSFCTQSQRAFDPTDAPIRRLWGFDPPALSYQVPKPEALAKALKQVNCTQMEVQRVPLGLFMGSTELSWELFTQGWLVSQGADLLTRSSLTGARLAMGAITYYHGAPADAPAWKVPVVHPRRNNELLTYLYLNNQSLAIVGDYQNYFTHNGRRLSSLLDPRTGYPAYDTIAVYVSAPDPLNAELLARAVAVLDDTGTRELLKSQPRSSITKLVERNGVFLPLNYAPEPLPTPDTRRR
ncbi:MAG: FAD:protein FMN transferase [Candidatus Sericytochromatia bacterium]